MTIKDGKGFRKTLKTFFDNKYRSFKTMVTRATLTTCANVGIFVAKKILKKVSLNGNNDFRQILNNEFQPDLDKQQEVIVVDPVKEDDNKE